MEPLFEELKDFRIIPVVVIHQADSALPLTDTLVRGGLACAEITLRTPAALDAIRKMARRKEMLVGAGTVLSIDQVKAACDSGARFVVSPGFNPELVVYCLENGIPVIPGVCTPTEVGNAMACGLEVLKFFPAESFGGLKTLKAISEPYADIRYIPTGGITPDNLADYLDFDKVLACGGTWIARSNLISDGSFDRILQNVTEALSIANRRNT